MPVERYGPRLIALAGEERAEIAHVWERAGRMVPALEEFGSRRLAELGGVSPITLSEDLRTLPNATLPHLAGYLRRAAAVQSGAGLPYTNALATLVREEQERRTRDLVG